MKIGIDFGHGVNCDGGAIGLIKEEDIINEVGSYLVAKLKDLGHEVVLCRPSNTSSLADSLYKRVYTANSNNVDLFVSIHANAGHGVGTEVYTYGGNEVPQARNVLNEIVNLGFNNRGIKDGSNLYVIRNTNAKAMLIEICFIDTQSDVDKYMSINANRIANAICVGLTGSTSNASISTSNNTTNTSKPRTEANNGVNLTLRDWQRAYNNTYNKNIAVDGIWGQQTEQAMRSTLIQFGQHNSLVGFVQCRVGVGIDEIFGNNTFVALLRYQKNHGLVDDGIAGYNTFRKMCGLS